MTDRAQSQAKLQRYRVMEPLGAGGAGQTFRGVDTQTHQDVAIKVLSLKKIGEWKTFDLFEREIAVLRTLEHPGIPRYVDSFEAPDSGDYFLVMELIEGRTLQDGLGDKRLTPGQLDGVFTQLLEILDYLHKLSPPVIHRDIKPANVMIDFDNNVHLVDFGAVRVAARGQGGSTMFGTIGYMAPEQLHGEATPASDLYSLAATMAALHAGVSADRLPHDGLRLDVDELDLPAHLAPVLGKMLSPEPRDRFQSVAQVRAQLRRSPLPGARKAKKGRRKARTDESRALAKKETSVPAEIPDVFRGLAKAPGPLKIPLWFLMAMGTGILILVEVVVMPILFRLLKQDRRKVLEDLSEDVRQVRRSFGWVAEQTNPVRDRDGK